VTDARYGRWFRAAGVLALLYAALVLLGGVLSLAGVTGDVYDPARGTAARLFAVYASRAAALAARVGVVGVFLLAAALPAFALRLARRTPALAWSGLGLAALSLTLRLVASLFQLAAFGFANGSSPALLASVPAGDLTLLFDQLAGALSLPATLAGAVWFILWGFAFLGGERRTDRVAGAALLATVAAGGATYAAFAVHAPLGGYAGIAAQTLAEASAFGFAGLSLLSSPPPE